MFHRVPRPFLFLFVTTLVSLFALAAVACTTLTKVQPPRDPTPVATVVKRVRAGQPTATPGKIARRVRTPTPINAAPSVRADTPTEIAPTVPEQVTASRASVTKNSAQTPARLIIPKIKLDANVREATWSTIRQAGKVYEDWLVPYDAVGHLDRTANTGQPGNMVISGHHNLIAPNKFGRGLFGEMWTLAVGDTVYVFDNAGRAFAYQVIKSYKVKEAGESLSVRSEHAREIMADTGEPILTMITCWNGDADPYSGNTYRWVVAARLVNAIEPSQVPIIAR